MLATRKFKLLFWLPRILAIVFAIALSTFALDVFDEETSILKKGLALFVHLLPSLLVVAALVIAWRRRILGGVLFIVLGIIYIANSRASLSMNLLIAVPLIVIGALFLLDAILNKYSTIRKSTIVD